MTRRAIPVVPGQVFGRWTVVAFHEMDPHYGTMALCRRDDGHELVLSMSAMRYRARKAKPGRAPATPKQHRAEDGSGILTQAQIAARLGLSVARVQQIEREALRKMAAALEGSDWAERPRRTA